MSWDTIHEEDEPCPCGKGFIHRETQMDDFNNFRELFPTINCEKCAKEYEIRLKVYPDSNSPTWQRKEYIVVKKKEK